MVGARRANQGIGAYVAAWFARSGAQVRAIVGTCDETVAQARSGRQQDRTRWMRLTSCRSISETDLAKRAQ